MRKRQLVANALLTLLVACASGPAAEPKSPDPASSPQEVQQKGPQADPPNSASGAQSNTGPSTYDGEKTQAIRATVGERFVVALPGNITTPFKWELDPEPNASVVRLAEHAYIDAPPKGCDGCVGFGGTATFTFEATGVGEEKLNLVYRGLGKGAPPKRTVAIQLTVR